MSRSPAMRGGPPHPPAPAPSPQLPDEDDEEAEEVSDDDVMDLKFRALQQRLLMKK